MVEAIFVAKNPLFLFCLPEPNLTLLAPAESPWSLHPLWEAPGPCIPWIFCDFTRGCLLPPSHCFLMKQEREMNLEIVNNFHTYSDDHCGDADEGHVLGLLALLLAPGQLVHQVLKVN